MLRRGARTSDRKMGVLWSGLLRPATDTADSNGGSGGTGSLLRDERKLSAFAVLDCAHSREAAAQLPSVLEAVQVQAEEAGASSKPCHLLTILALLRDKTL